MATGKTIVHLGSLLVVIAIAFALAGCGGTATTTPAPMDVSPAHIGKPTAGPVLSESFPEAIAYAINDNGQIVGAVRSSEGLLQACLWSDGVAMTLGTLGGEQSSAHSIAHSINNRGQIVGEAAAAPGGIHAFLWSEGVLSDLGTLGGTNSRAVAINERGQIVGMSETGSGKLHAFLWQDGVMTDIGPPLLESQAMDINQSGEVVGALILSDEYGDHMAVHWVDRKQHEVIKLGGDWLPMSVASRIADDGAMIGVFQASQGFYLKDGERTALGGLGGDETEPLGVNTHGQVVGYAITTDGHDHAFLWQDGAMTDLGTLGGDESHAWGINEHGQIVGGARTDDGRMHAFVWQDGVMSPLPIDSVRRP